MTKIKSKLINLIIFLIVSDVLLYIPIVEIQLILFNQLLVTNAMIKSAILLFIAVSILLSGLKNNILEFKRFITVVLIELGIILPLVSLFNTGSIYNAYLIFGRGYIYFIYAFFFIYFRKEINFERLIKWIFVIGIINALVSFIQFQFGWILYPYTEYPNGEPIFETLSFWVGRHSYRSVGISKSGYECGLVMVYALLYAVFKLTSQDKLIKKLQYGLSILLLLYALYATLTRSIYLLVFYIFGYLILYALPIKEKTKDSFAKAIPFIAILVFIIVFITCQEFVFNLEGEQLFNSTTIKMRFSEWSSAISQIASNPLKMFIGYAEAQFTGLLIDNVYIDITYAMGIIGLIILTYYYVRLTLSLYDKGKKNRFLYYQYIFTSSMLVIGFANLICVPYGLLAVSIPAGMLMKEN